MPIDITLPTQFHGILSTIGWFDVLDILIVAVILYKVYEMLQDTRAITLVKGILVLLGVTMVCSWFDLHVISWLLQKAVTLLFVALPIVFQPELRRALEHLGQGTFFASSNLLNDEEARNVAKEITKAVKQLAATKTGALLVIERDMGLNDVCDTGIQIEGLISAEFLLNVFIVNTPLHDGASVIRGNRLIAAGCLLPLTENRRLSTELGTRHRAAIGLSEQCDALIVVVSEETGTISIAENGHIMRHLSPEYLQELLMPAFEAPKTNIKDMVRSWRGKV
ncbi:MAG: diadenylate cyclase CdaA [Selenomonas sp.]|jgi:diadenylate cyclase|uniref:diadenylate cyclase CdaA n=1 Tax=Selenomonas sp. AE3005 TaxID=1485543 RepID=UPI00047F6BB5|nr:diadenylate cyclase CdaA [Selenomonas sp. AE3005]MBQ1415947.1 diadenylate cyclase CdaA [Selenomonas sp.]MBQ1461268.1 diadenylate cyclase CdaA [Selenomonas sp.]MBQ1613528.1 diadenylate cyclase CdaA [Selenomonas sp.]MBQ1808133.1 diadenylate cyclase CdaA [Selenomonas sp.]MBQ2088476.1 diadenylate cyclase CdaA [Selenomonas sp.]